MLKKVFLALFMVTAMACTAANPRVDLDSVGGIKLKPDAQHAIIVKDLIGLFESVHYKKVPLNDSLSSVVFDKFLKDLDQGKNYFLAGDIAGFEQYRNTICTDFRNGDLSSMYHIFNVFEQRALERFDYALSKVDSAFDFSKDETFVYDRENMPWFADKAEADDVWDKRVKYDLLNLKLSSVDAGSEEKNRETLRKRYQNLISQTKQTNSNDAFQRIMDAFTGAIDPHTNYFNPYFAQDFNENMARSFEGIGARLQLENEVIKVVEVIPGGPVFKSKALQVDDRIIGVAQGKDGEFEDVIGWRLDHSVSKIKGPKGTVVRLKVIPAGQELTVKPKIVSLVRDRIVLEEQSAKKEVKEVRGEDGKTYKVGIIKVPGFYMDVKAANAGDPNYKSTTRDVRYILDTLKKEQVDAVLVDLRSNGGGSLTEAIELTGLFIEKGPVVQVRDMRNRVEVNEDEDPEIVWDGPMGVMIDRFSASASEIFAGAIQDYGRGIIIGTQTYGKGTVQSAIDMNRVISPANKILLKAQAEAGKIKINAPEGAPRFGQINLTMAKFYRISGSSTQHKGVIPDIEFPMIYPAEKFGESAEPAALPWDQIEPSGYQPVADLTPLKETLSDRHEKRMKASPEYRYLLEDIELMRKRESETSVTLRENQLKKEREETETKNLERVNTRRKLQGLPPLKKGETIPKTGVDFIQDESLQVMADLIGMKQQ